MRSIRLALYFVIGVLLGSWVVLARAETMTPTAQGYKAYSVVGSDPVAVCKQYQESIGWKYEVLVPNLPYPPSCYGSFNGSTQGFELQLVKVCPPGQNWTLSGSSCSRPECVGLEVRDPADGICKAPECPPGTSKVGKVCKDVCAEFLGVENYEGLWVNPAEFTGYCVAVGAQNCAFVPSRVEPKAGYVTSGILAYPASAVWSKGAGSCGVVTQKGSPTIPPYIPEKKPPCGPTEGVLTSTSGTVACVPPGTPTARTPEITDQVKKESFPDGTIKETTNKTTKDPLTGAQTVTSETVTTGLPDGSQGQAGPVGVSGGSTSGNGKDGNGDGQGDGDGNCEGNDCGNDKKMPDVDGLWEKKYPNGIEGVLNEKMNALKATGVYQLINQLAPANLPNAGICPSFSFDMNMGSSMNFGGAALNMPCGVWDFIRIVFLISSGLLARRLIFGG